MLRPPESTLCDDDGSLPSTTRVDTNGLVCTPLGPLIITPHVWLTPLARLSATGRDTTFAIVAVVAAVVVVTDVDCAVDANGNAAGKDDDVATGAVNVDHGGEVAAAAALADDADDDAAVADEDDAAAAAVDTLDGAAVVAADAALVADAAAGTPLTTAGAVVDTAGALDDIVAMTAAASADDRDRAMTCITRSAYGSAFHSLSERLPMYAANAETGCARAGEEAGAVAADEDVADTALAEPLTPTV